MTRKDFLKLTGALLASPLFAETSTNGESMPSIFIGHGSPMNIVRDNLFTQNLKNITKTFPKPKAIVVVSAHWYTDKLLVSNSEEQETIYDFYNFPDELYNIFYEPKGDPTLAKNVANLLGGAGIEDRGLDHGAWSVLHHMYPKRDVPTFQISINKKLNYLQHFQLGQLLSKLRERGVLVIGSGSVTHNLRLSNRYSKKIDDWSVVFDNFVKDSFSSKNFNNIINAKQHPLFKVSHPWDDHYIPLLYVAGTIKKEDKISHFHEEIVSQNLSMRCIKVG